MPLFNIDSKTFERDYYGLVTHIAKRFFHDPRDFEDALQIGYEAVVEAARGYAAGKGASFNTYAYRQIKWAFQNYRRSFTRDCRKSLPREDSVACEVCAAPRDDHTDDTDLAELQRAIASLEPVERVVVRLYCLEERTLREVGDQLGMCQENVRLIKEQAMRHLRDYFYL
jgi:RNA polymerase sigma factor (sigma-70 family)